jgi:hypothetical protein
MNQRIVRLAPVFLIAIVLLIIIGVTRIRQVRQRQEAQAEKVIQYWCSIHAEGVPIDCPKWARETAQMHPDLARCSNDDLSLVISCLESSSIISYWPFPQYLYEINE